MAPQGKFATWSFMLSASQIVFERYFEHVFQPVSFQLDDCELLLVTGANGCGKTTLIRVLAGILHPSSGKIDNQAGGMAYVGHFLGIKDDLSVLENLRFIRDFLGRHDHGPGLFFPGISRDAIYREIKGDTS